MVLGHGKLWNHFEIYIQTLNVIGADIMHALTNSNWREVLEQVDNDMEVSKLPLNAAI